MTVRDTPTLNRQWRSDPLLTVDEVAAIFKVGRRTVWRWADEGLIDRVRLGRNISRYTAASVEALIIPETSQGRGTSPDLDEAAEVSGRHGSA